MNRSLLHRIQEAFCIIVFVLSELQLTHKYNAWKTHPIACFAKNKTFRDRFSQTNTRGYCFLYGLASNASQEYESRIRILVQSLLYVTFGTLLIVIFDFLGLFQSSNFLCSELIMLMQTLCARHMKSSTSELGLSENSKYTKAYII
jgi:hypothetical protein